MEMNELRRAIVRSAVHKGIEEVREDPKRGIRKLVDLGSHFSRGRFQKLTFEVMQKELTDADSAYYAMVMRLIRCVRPEILEEFGLNVGYNSWTHGAQVIRAHEAEHGYNVPWCLVLDLRQGMGYDVDELMRQGEKLGIYAYLVFGGGRKELDELYPIFRRHRDCAVMVLLRTPELPLVNVENVSNVMLLVPQGEPGARESAAELEKRGCLYGTWVHYSDGKAGAILSGAAEELAEELGAVTLMAVSEPGTSEETRERVVEYAMKAREHKRHLPFLAEFFSDIERIDRIISVEPCMLGIHADGTVFTAQGSRPNLNVQNIALEDILMCTMPRVTYNPDEKAKE